LNYVIAGTLIEKISGIRFDIYMKQRILSKISSTMNFNPADILNSNDLSVLYTGSNGKWVASQDNYKGGSIPQRNLTGYTIGTNGAIYGPQGSIRCTVTDLLKYINMIRENGIYKNNTILKPESVN
jgi:hypothetical protein